MKNKNFKFYSLKFLFISINLTCLILLLFGYFSIKNNLVIASGDSMIPTIRSGNAIVFEKQEKYALFEIVVFKINGIVITHRVVDIKNENGETFYVCSGDNVPLYEQKNKDFKNEYIKNLSLDETREIDSIQIVSENEILGKVKVNSKFLGIMIRFRVLILLSLAIPTLWLILKK